MASSAELINKAIFLLQQGKVGDAEGVFDSVLRAHPKNFDALHMLGIIYAQRGSFAEAEKLLRKALSIDAGVAPCVFNYASVLCKLGRFQDAIDIFNKAARLAPNHAPIYLDRGNALYELKRYEEALASYEKALVLNPNFADAWVGRGNALIQLKHCDEAIAAFDKALAGQPNLANAWLGRGNVLYELNRYDAAFAAYDKALALKPNLENAWFGRGNVLYELKRYDEAFAAYDKALALKPDLENAWLGRGNLLYELKRYDEAFAAYDEALALKADLAEAWLGRGNVFTDLKRHDEAVAAYDKALALKADLAEAWLGRGNVFTDLKRHDEALVAYDKALALKSDLEGAWFGRGNVFLDLKRYDEACAAYDKALALKSDLEGAWLGRGNVFFDLKRYDEAFAAYDKALALKPDLAEAWLGRGNVFSHLKRYDEAFVAYDKAFAIKPDLVGVEGARLRSKMDSCNWDNFASDCNHLIGSVKSNKTNTLPFVLLEINSSVEDQFNCAELWVQKNYPPAIKPFWAGELYKHDKIRIGYVSADFRQHPVAYLMAGVFECHNKSRFDVVAISIGPKDNSELRQRLERSFDKFIDASALSVDEIATKIKNAEIDILIDLNGFTQNARTEVFARRPAPIQVNYLGYLGTMGAEYIDYIVADRTVIPETQKHLYMEKIIYLPNSFQPTDRQRHISDKIFMRADCGLPQEGFVFCNFNAHYKITPDVFDIWMRILMRVNGSVLWLVAGNPTTESNLKKEALVRGVNAERLIFAPPVPLPEHQARLRLADLFLDTLPYNAGATASDTLWAGIPLLTCIGDTFVGRMAASVLEAISLPELITTTPEAYERMAVDLATHPEKLAAIRHKLAENRLTTPLFNTRLFTKHIEAAYIAMHERHQAGLAPDHIVIPNCAH